MSNKKKWQSPEYKTLSSLNQPKTAAAPCIPRLIQSLPSCNPIQIFRVPAICNVSWPQRRVCLARNVPQRTIQCSHKARTLS